MSQLPALNVDGTRFVLTGRMWTVRKTIAKQIHWAGGVVEDRIIPGAVLVIASSQLKQGIDGKWYTHDKGARKVHAAIAQGALVYHEAILRDVLRRRERFMSGQAMAARLEQPLWNDDLMDQMAQVVAGMQETSELLAQF